MALFTRYPAFHGDGSLRWPVVREDLVIQYTDEDGDVARVAVPDKVL